jgi:hypothetical protein
MEYVLKIMAITIIIIIIIALLLSQIIEVMVVDKSTISKLPLLQLYLHMLLNIYHLTRLAITIKLPNL